MRMIVPALAAAFIGMVGAGSTAQAAVHSIDFSAVALCPATCTGISYTGPNLGASTAIDLDGSTWIVSLTKFDDESGLSSTDPLTLTPTTATFGALSGPVDVTLSTPIIKSWDGAFGSFTETLTTLTEVVRGINQIGFVLTGTVSGGAFVDVPATMIFSFTQSGGPGNVVSASLTNSTAGAVPEPSTWVMLILGFAGLGYAAVRRSGKDRSAFAI